MATRSNVDKVSLSNNYNKYYTNGVKYDNIRKRLNTQYRELINQEQQYKLYIDNLIDYINRLNKIYKILTNKNVSSITALSQNNIRNSITSNERTIMNLEYQNLDIILTNLDLYLPADVTSLKNNYDAFYSQGVMFITYRNVFISSNNAKH